VFALLTVGVMLLKVLLPIVLVVLLVRWVWGWMCSRRTGDDSA
jgi:hypothetical protein